MDILRPEPRTLPDLPDVEHRFVDVDGLRTHVALAGHGDPLVLLHAWPAHWWQWRHVIPALAEHHRVICPDLRGLGWTDAPPTGYRPSVHARDVLGLLDRLGVGRFGLVGHDWGGAAGYLIALRHPERVTGYLALSTASPFLRPTPHVLSNGPRLWHLFANTLTDPKRIVDWALRHWLPGGFPDDDRAIFRAQFDEPGRVRATTRYYRDAVRREIPLTLAGQYRWARLSMPVVTMAGEADPLIHLEHMLDLDGYADDVRAEPLPGVGHFPATEAPDRVIEAALRLFTHEPSPVR